MAVLCEIRGSHGSRKEKLSVCRILSPCSLSSRYKPFSVTRCLCLQGGSVHTYALLLATYVFRAEVHFCSKNEEGTEQSTWPSTPKMNTADSPETLEPTNQTRWSHVFIFCPYRRSHNQTHVWTVPSKWVTHSRLWVNSTFFRPMTCIGNRVQHATDSRRGLNISVPCLVYWLFTKCIG
jgi:hypothetical protein